MGSSPSFCFSPLFPSQNLACFVPSFLEEEWFLAHPDPLELNRQCTRDELKLALLVFEEMQLCLRLGLSALTILALFVSTLPFLCSLLCADPETFCVMESRQDHANALIFLPLLCSEAQATSPWEAVFRTLPAGLPLCSGFRL